MEKLSEGEWKLMELLWEDAPVNSTPPVEQEHHLHGAPPPVPQGGGGQ